ncbi:MAG: hypothetical protein ACPGUV_05240 [Polyangiales bacterium]
MVEPDGRDGPHASNTVDFFVVPAGVHFLPDGTLVEAGSLSVSAVQASDVAYPSLTTRTAQLDFQHDHASPLALLTEIQTIANEGAAPPGEPPNPWLTVAVTTLDTSGAALALERSESECARPQPRRLQHRPGPRRR